jgi:hypothetical protein
MGLEHSIRTLDPAGRYVAVCVSHHWTVCDLAERRIVGQIHYDDPAWLGLNTWQADVPRDRAYLGFYGKKVACRVLSTGEVLWEKKASNPTFTINPRTGHLLVDARAVQLWDCNSGQCIKKGAPPQETEFALTHPELPVTLHCRFERIPRPGEQAEFDQVNIFEFFHEDTGAKVTLRHARKGRPFMAFFHATDCYIQEIGGVIHKVDVNTGEKAWTVDRSLVDRKRRGESFGIGGFNQPLGSLVFQTPVHTILWMDPANGSILKETPVPCLWTSPQAEHCIVDHHTKLLLMDGRMFDVATMECIEESVFDRMGLTFGLADIE